MATYTLSEDTVRAFKDAVDNGQTRLALEYAVLRFEELEARIAELEARPATVVSNSTASSRKVTKASVEAEDGVEQ